MKYTVFALVIASLAVQVSARDDVALQKGDISDNVRKILALATQIVADSFTPIIDSFIGLIKHGESTLDSAHGKIAKLLVEVTKLVKNLFLDLLETTNENADENGQKLISCVASQNNNVDSFLNSSVTDLVFCSTIHSIDLFESGRKVFEDLSGSLKNISSSAEDLESCASEPSVCTSAFVGEIKVIGRDFLKTLSTDAAIVTDVLNQIRAVRKVCFKDFLSSLQPNFIDVINDVAKCASN